MTPLRRYVSGQLVGEDLADTGDLVRTPACGRFQEWTGVEMGYLNAERGCARRADALLRLAEE